MNKTITLLLLTACTVALGAEVPPWYKTIQPFTQREQLLKTSGPPDRTENGKDIYELAQGRIEVTYENHFVKDCHHLDPGGGAVSMSYYWMFSPDSSDSTGIPVTEFLSRGRYDITPALSGLRVRCHRIDGLCFLAEDGYLVIRPIISLLGGTGYFADKAAAVVLVRNGREETLYRACDNWPKLNPPGITKEELDRRSQIVLGAANYVDARALMTALGDPDSEMGSGIGYSLYYLQKGLLTLSDHTDLNTLTADQPGSDLAPNKRTQETAHQAASDAQR